VQLKQTLLGSRCWWVVWSASKGTPLLVALDQATMAAINPAIDTGLAAGRRRIEGREWRHRKHAF
jgi:hypothetical protein